MADVINELKPVPIESISVICENIRAIRVLKSIIRLIANTNFTKRLVFK